MIGSSATLLTSALSFASAAAPVALGGGNEPDIPIIRLFLGLILCVVVAIVAALALRRMKLGGSLNLNVATLLGGSPSTREIEVREVRRLSPQAEALCLHWAGSDYLIVVSTGAISLIDKRQDPPPTP